MAAPKYLVLATGLAAALAALGPAAHSAPAADPNDPEACYECHKQECDESLAKPFIHLPFLRRECHVCHLAPTRTATKGARGRATTDMPRNLRWLGESGLAQPEHVFVIPPADVDDVLYVKASNGHGGLVSEQLDLPPLEDLPPLVNDHTPPRIADLKVKEVRRGVFYSATIAWRTDEVADSRVLYGVGAMDNESPTDNDLSLKHEVLLSGLKAKTTYSFRVASQDMFGNRSESQAMELSTATSVSPVEVAAEAGSEVIELEHTILRNGDRYLVRFAANQPVRLAVGAPPPVRTAAAPEPRARASKPDDHPPLRSELETNITICYTCHKEAKDVLSHPVNVYPREGMTIPEEYNTLEDGRITCNSCHADHGASIEFRLRKPSKKELCIGCHKDLA
ncbi:MAG: cytochrome c3 family protein [Thermodesulfobacteriota bacterium]